MLEVIEVEGLSENVKGLNVELCLKCGYFSGKRFLLGGGYNKGKNEKDPSKPRARKPESKKQSEEAQK